MFRPAADLIHCSLCGRQIPPRLITQHHLRPKSRGGKPDDCVPMCRPCHKQLHVLFDNHTLERELSDLDTLRRSPALQRFVKWIRKQPTTASVVTRESKSLRSRKQKH